MRGVSVIGRTVDNTEPTRTKPTRRSEGSHKRHAPQAAEPKAAPNALTVGQNRHTATPNALTLIRNAGEKRRAPQPEPKLLDRKLETLSAGECLEWREEFLAIPKSSQQVRKRAEHAAKLLGLRYAHPGTLKDIQKAIRDKLKAGWLPIHPDRGGAKQCFQLIEIAREAMEKSLNQRGKKT